jgi:hypothetical protein
VNGHYHFSRASNDVVSTGQVIWETMCRVPILIEVEEAKDASICGKVVQALLKDLTDILNSLKDHKLTPSIFIVNTMVTSIPSAIR